MKMPPEARIVVPRAWISFYVKRVAQWIDTRIATTYNPQRTTLLLGVGLAGCRFAEALASQLTTPIDAIDTVHCVRYNADTNRPADEIKIVNPEILDQPEKQVILADCFMDSGLTLQTLQKNTYCRMLTSVVLLRRGDHFSSLAYAAYATNTPDFLFGYGLDYHNEFRELNDIYGVPQ